MAKLSQDVLVQYLEWHFLDQPRLILKAWKNLLRFNLNYWSVLPLLKTFFSHWRRYRYSYGRGINLGRYFEAFTFNMISRILGAIMRSFFISIGLLTEVLIAVFGAAVFFVWIFLPILLLAGLYFGFKVLI